MFLTNKTSARERLSLGRQRPPRVCRLTMYIGKESFQWAVCAPQSRCRFCLCRTHTQKIIFREGTQIELKMHGVKQPQGMGCQNKTEHGPKWDMLWSCREIGKQLKNSSVFGSEKQKAHHYFAICIKKERHFNAICKRVGEWLGIGKGVRKFLVWWASVVRVCCERTRRRRRRWRRF